VLRAASTVPEQAVNATISMRGSNNAIVKATASSIPGSQSMINLRVIKILVFAEGFRLQDRKLNLDYSESTAFFDIEVLRTFSQKATSQYFNRIVLG
jgi:hypothetical protein